MGIEIQQSNKIWKNVRGALSKVTTRYRKEFPKLKLETQGTEGEIEMLRIVYPWTGYHGSRILADSGGFFHWLGILGQDVPSDERSISEYVTDEEFLFDEAEIW